MLIFCYGSNMLSDRLHQRISYSRTIGIGKLSGHLLKFHKVGRDRSGKCDVSSTGIRKDHVWGIVVEIDPAEKATLDQYEDYGIGYSEKTVEIEMDSGDKIKSLVYYALWIDPLLNPYDWYLDFVLAGAREHNLPEYYIKSIESIRTIPDPDINRSQLNRKILNKL